MKLSFKYIVNNMSSKQDEIITKLKWQIEKVYNGLLYEYKEEKSIR